jgi:hypothetical protein
MQALEAAIKQFRTREEVWPLRVPREPLLLDPIVRRALDHEASRFDLMSLRARTLLHLRWDDGSEWELWVLPLASGTKLYCDSSHDESRILASGRRDSEIDTERLFLELLAESAGEVFGIEIRGGLPSRVRSSIDKRDQLVEFFVHLFEVAHMEDDVRAQSANSSLPRRSAEGAKSGLPRRSAEGAKSGDFREDVERWLNKAMR